MALPKNILALLDKRGELIRELETATAAKRRKLAEVQAELDQIAAPFNLKILELADRITTAAEASAEEIFGKKKSHEHAGQKLSLTTSKSIQSEDEEESILSLESVVGDEKALAASCIAIKASLNKKQITCSHEGNEAFFQEHGITFLTTTKVKLTDATA